MEIKMTLGLYNGHVSLHKKKKNLYLLLLSREKLSDIYRMTIIRWQAKPSILLLYIV
jgi:hypothetical protein